MFFAGKTWSGLVSVVTHKFPDGNFARPDKSEQEAFVRESEAIHARDVRLAYGKLTHACASHKWSQIFCSPSLAKFCDPVSRVSSAGETSLRLAQNQKMVRRDHYSVFCARHRTRTYNIHNVNVALYQLS